MNYIIPFIILITIVVFIHEYGHYYFARRYGVAVTDFSIGFGKEIFGFNDKSGTRWKFCLIPLGGYVKFFGDRNVFSQAEQKEILKKYSKSDQEKLFVTKPLYQRALIVAGGPLANFLLAIVIFSFIYMFVGKDFTPAKIEEVAIESPAEKAGLKKNDIIIGINNNKIESILEVSMFINTTSTDKISIKVLRNQRELTLVAEPNITESKDAFGNPIKKKIIGIKIGPASDEFNREKLGPAKAVYYSVKEIWFVCKTTIQFIGSLFQGKGDTSQLGGPIKIAKISGQVMEFGILAFLSTVAYISISLGLINLFPIPLLDGGHIIYFTLRSMFSNTLPQVITRLYIVIGISIISFLFILVTINDIFYK